MLAKIIYIAAVALEFVFVPLFLKYSWPEKCWKSFRLKMVCSALFITVGVCSIVISGNHTKYAKMMFIGLVLGMIGDLFLHLITDKMAVFGVGLLSFLVGHIFFIIAFADAMSGYLPSARVFDWRAIIAVVALVGICVAIAVLKKMKFGIAAVPVLLYAITISIMLVTAFQLCFQILINGLDYDYNLNIVGIFCTVALGALLFLMSDATLAVILFGGQNKNRPLKIFNIGTYFAGQILLASSIMLVSSV